MNVACSQCSAKYAINDDRVKGRKVRIKCKRCGNSFVVDGTAETEDAGAAPFVRSATPNPGAVAAVTTDAANPNLWMVAITDDDTREMTTEQVIDAYAERTIDQYSYLWREGMADWQAPFEVAEIAKLLKARGFQVSEDALPPPGAGAGGVVWREPGRPSEPLNPALSSYQGDESDNEVTRAISRAALENSENAEELPQRIEDAQGLAPPLTAPEPFFGAPTRAKVSDRPSGVDLFGGLPKNAEPEPQATTGTTEDSTLTGARHESSVLFSLNALVSSEEAKTAKRAARVDPSSDDAFLSSSAGPPSDPIATLTASVDPMLAPPPPSVPSMPSIAPAVPAATPSVAPPRSAASGVLLTFLGFALALGGIAAVVALGLVPGLTFAPAGSEPPPPMPTVTPSPVEPVATATAPVALPSAVPSAPVAVPSAAIPSATATASAPAPMASSSAKVKPAGSAAPAAATATAAMPTPTAATAAAPTAAPATPTAAPAATETAAAAPAPAPAAAGGFNTDAAKAALASAAANATANCKVAGTPAGTSKVTVTFVPSGKATQALVAGDFAGTPAGSCIARVFRGAQIPSFSGDSVTVTKSVTLR
ncbi:MAG TPA: zinc-ribbon domain-containing protein [Polyangiaceae bacterium]|nr:zinc-ribbon domain-containing protein [Polyangiaceae bacterium]